MQAATGCLRTLMSCTSPGLAQGRAFVQGAWHLQRSGLSFLHMNRSSGSWLLSQPLEASGDGSYTLGACVTASRDEADGDLCVWSRTSGFSTIMYLCLPEVTSSS